MQKKAFTLVEMLIVIVIIGILAAALIPKLQGLQARARDTKRIHDIRNFAEGIYTYWMDSGLYPDKGNTGDGNRGVGTKPGFLSILVPNYMKDIPKDPINKDTPSAFWTLKTGDVHDYYYVYYAYPGNSAYNSGCSFAGSQFAVIGAVTIEALKNSVPMVNAFCTNGRNRNDEIDYPYAIQSKGEFY